jgi:hypothetical protein
MISQNATFRGDVPEDTEFQHPPGAWLSRCFATEIETAGWRTSEIENWNDCGWSVVCSRHTAKLEVVLAATGSNDWMLQVSAFSSPGILRRLFGAQPSASPSDILALAELVHGILTRTSRFSHIRWLPDGPPDEKHSTPTPSA